MMTAIAHMPDSAVRNGVADDTAALQAMFNACPVGGLCIIPDGVFRTTALVQVPRPMNVWCSPGAHIKGDFSGSGAVVHAFWHTPNGTSDQYVAMEGFFWQGGVISRLNRNGPCIRVSAGLAGSVQNLRTLRGSPHVQIDAPDTASGWYRGGSGPNWGAMVRVAYCRGYDGGTLGIVNGPLPNWAGSGQCNGNSVEHCYFQGDGAAGSVGMHTMNGGTAQALFNTFDNYETDVINQNSSWSRVFASNKRVGSATTLYRGQGSGGVNRATLFDPRGGITGNTEYAGRDPQGAYT
jgi:hypothetical protein